jgi:hypothetical protein
MASGKTPPLALFALQAYDYIMTKKRPKASQKRHVKYLNVSVEPLLHVAVLEAAKATGGNLSGFVTGMIKNSPNMAAARLKVLQERIAAGQEPDVDGAIQRMIGEVDTVLANLEVAGRLRAELVAFLELRRGKVAEQRARDGAAVAELADRVEREAVKA